MLPIISTVPLADGTVHVRLIGEFDLAAAPALHARLQDAIAWGPHLLVSVGTVTFLDCCCLGILNAARLQAAERGGSLRLVGSAPCVTRLLSLTKLADHFPAYQDLSSATAGPG